jgi:hypothetical protein
MTEHAKSLNHIHEKTKNGDGYKPDAVPYALKVNKGHEQKEPHLENLSISKGGMMSMVNLEDLIPVSNVEVEEVEEGLKLSDMGYVRTTQVYGVPLKINVVAKTDSTNIRLHYAKGHIIFNWEVNQDTLAGFEPVYGHCFEVTGQGRVKTNEWVDITWAIHKDYMEVLVDGELRFSNKEDSFQAFKITTGCSEYKGNNYKNLLGSVGFGPAWGSVITVKSVQIEELDKE